MDTCCRILSKSDGSQPSIDPIKQKKKPTYIPCSWRFGKNIKDKHMKPNEFHSPTYIKCKPKSTKPIEIKHVDLEVDPCKQEKKPTYIPCLPCLPSLEEHEKQTKLNPDEKKSDSDLPNSPVICCKLKTELFKIIDEMITQSEVKVEDTCKSLGKGTYGTVKSISKTVVRKKMYGYLDGDIDSAIPCFMEIACLKALKGIPHIVQYIPETLSLTTVQLERFNFNLDEVIRDQKRILTFGEKKKMFFDIIDGINSIHNRNIYHCDLKPQNILIGKVDGDDNEVAICDFGISQFSHANKTYSIGFDWDESTPLDEHICSYMYKPPELTISPDDRILPLMYEKIDIWTLALIGLELFSGKSGIFRPNDEDDEDVDHRDLLEKFYNGIDFKNFFSTSPINSYTNCNSDEYLEDLEDLEDLENLKDLLKHMFDLNSATRFTIKQVLSHKFFSGFAPFEKPLSAIQKIKKGRRIKPKKFLTNQPELTKKMIIILYDWLIDVAMKFKLKDRTVFHAFKLIERYMELKQVSRKKLQLTGIIALYISSWINEIFSIELRDCIYISARAFDRTEAINKVLDILTRLDYDVFTTTIYDYVYHYAITLNWSKKMFYSARFILYLHGIYKRNIKMSYLKKNIKKIIAFNEQQVKKHKNIIFFNKCRFNIRNHPESQLTKFDKMYDLIKSAKD